MNAESRGGTWWVEVGLDQDHGQGRGGRRRGPVVQRELAQAAVGAGQAIQALGARSRASLPALGGGCGGGSVAVPAAVVLTRRRLQASRRQQEVGQVALHGHKERQAHWAGGRRGRRAAAWVPR